MNAKSLLNPQGSMAGQEDPRGSHMKGSAFSPPLSIDKRTGSRIILQNSHQLNPCQKPNTQAAIINRRIRESNIMVINGGQESVQMVDSECQYVKHLQTILSVLEESHALSVVLRDKNRRLYQQSLSSIQKTRVRLQLRQQGLLKELQELEHLIDSQPEKYAQQ